MKGKMIRNTIFILLIFVMGVSCNGNSKRSNAVDYTTDSDILQEETRTRVLIETNMGDMTVELYNETPLHRDNFIKLVNEDFFDGVLFHRVIDQFMIQAGDPQSKDAEPGVMLGNGGPGYTIPAEFVEGLIHEKGALSAARQGDNVNPEKESSGSQFYIVQGRTFTNEELEVFQQRMGKSLSADQIQVYTTVGGTPHLDGDYTVFGKVVDGLEIIDVIAAVETDRNNRPLEDVVIKDAKIVK